MWLKGNQMPYGGFVFLYSDPNALQEFLRSNSQVCVSFSLETCAL